MNKREAKKFEKLLLAEQSRLREGIKRIEESTLHDSSGDNIADITSYAEFGTDNFERETALNIASNESERLREINDALARIQEGTYGKCEGCGTEIPKKRLEVFPSARYCVECQSKIERDGTL
ncbi:MAG: TraR/DksA family transcriptional regulator [Candidatus Hydrogenedentota bacterium]